MENSENPMTPKEKQQIYESEYSALLKRLDLKVMYVIEFPTRAKLPILSRIALNVIARQGGRAGVRFIDLTK